MKPYIFTSKKGVYLIDINQTKTKLDEALTYMAELLKTDKTILFVGTKNQVRVPLEAMAKELALPYVTGKWLGGYLTNFAVVKKSIKKYQDLLAQRDGGKLDKYNKKEQLNISREIKRLEDRVAGLAMLTKLPDALFVWDIKKEETAINEAIAKEIPIIAICDTNVDPTLVDYPIPANDDSSKTVKLILSEIKDMILAAREEKSKAQ